MHLDVIQAEMQLGLGWTFGDEVPGWIIWGQFGGPGPLATRRLVPQGLGPVQS